MVLNITEEDRKRFEEYLKKAEPYSKEEFEKIEYDATVDVDRMNATKAKFFLEGKI